MKWKIGDEVMVTERITHPDYEPGTVTVVVKITEEYDRKGRYDPKIYLEHHDHWYASTQLRRLTKLDKVLL